jgi:CBS domain-containing protein
MHSSVVSIPREASLVDAARAFRSANVGTLAVTDGGAISGVLSERDLIDAVAHDLDLSSTLVGEAMTVEPRYLTVGDDVSSALRMMLAVGVRHLPVLDDGNLVGIVSIRDLAAVEAAEDRQAGGS